MDFEIIRPILSGLAGAAIATYFCNKWAQELPRIYNGKDQKKLVKENRVAIYLANTIFLLSLFGGIGAYHLGYFEDNDWRGLGLFGGFALFSPLALLILFSYNLGHKRVAEAFLAYSINQKMPPKLLLTILIAGTVIFFITCVILFI